MSASTIRPQPSTTTAVRRRVLLAERRSLRRRLDHAEGARDAAEARILALTGTIERIDRELARVER